MMPDSFHWYAATGQGAKTAIQEIPYRHKKKNLFTVRVAEQWNRLPRQIVESPSQEIFKTCLDTFLSDLIKAVLLRREDWTT